MQFTNLRGVVSSVKVTADGIIRDTMTRLKEAFGALKTLFEHSGKEDSRFSSEGVGLIPLRYLKIFLYSLLFFSPF
jgi:hypothetical protein